MDFSKIILVFPEYLSGLQTTVTLLVLSLATGLFLSLAIALIRTSKNPIMCWFARGFIFFFRGSPLLVQIFIIYYGLPQFALIKESFLWEYFKQPYFCAWLALTLNNAGYTAEIIYNAIIATKKGEIEASEAFGMSKTQSMLFVILPSVIRRAIPAYGNEAIFMLHATALVSLITILDLTGVARLTYARYYNPFEAFITAGLFYLTLTIVMTMLFRLLEKKLNVHRRT